MKDMRSFRDRLTLGRVRGFIYANDLSRFTAEELWQIWDWLDDLSIEVGLIGQVVRRAHAKKEWNQAPLGVSDLG